MLSSFLYRHATGAAILASVLILVISFSTPGAAEQKALSRSIKLSDIRGLESLANWEKPLRLKKGAYLRLFQFALADGTKISILSGKDLSHGGKVHLRPYLTAGTRPTSVFAQDAKALAAVNGGYFNLSDGLSASYVVIDGKLMADPTQNHALVDNPRLQPFLPQIFKRSELRTIKNGKGYLHYVIAAHDQTLSAGETLIDSLQAGPRLLPTLTAEDEAFVRREANGQETDSIGVKRTAARTAIGLGGNGEFILVSVAGKKQDEFSAGITLDDLAILLKNLGAVSALNFDGGTSTTQVLEKSVLDGVEPEGEKMSAAAGAAYTMLVGREPETRVKSALCLVESE